MDNDTLMWAILIAFCAGLGFFIVLGVIAYRQTRRRDAHLARHGTRVSARVVDAHPRHVHVNNSRGWVIVVAWTDPHSGIEHRFESDLVFTSSTPSYASVRARCLAIGELPVHVDLAMPAQYHAVDTSSVRL